MRLLLVTLGLATLIARLVQAWSAWSTGNELTHVSGAWIALAMDSADGVLYRPLFSDGLGYGGTQYFPLHIVLHGWLIRAFGDPLLAGYLLSGVSSILLVGALFAIFRRAGHGFVCAAALALLVETSHAVSNGLLTIRGDVLPAALTAWGLFFVSRGPAGRSLWAAAALFTTAFAAKFTAVHGVVATGLWLARGREWRSLVRLLVATAIGFTGVLVATQMVSGGRFLEVLRACAGGGAGFGTFARAPARFLMFLPGDVGATVLFVLASAMLLARRPTWKALPTGSYLWVTVLITIVIFGNPGTFRNQLVDLAVASVLVIGTTAAADRERSGEIGVAAAAVAGLVTLIGPSLLWAKDDLRGPRTDLVAETRALLRRHGGPRLSDDPLAAAIGGEKPYLLDVYMYELLRLRDPSLEEPLLRRVRRREFRVILLQSRHKQDRERLGPRFAAELRRAYTVAETTGRYEAYVPRPD